MKRDWEMKALGDVCAIARGGSPRPIQAFLTDAEDGVNWIKISDATASGKYIYSTAEKIKPAGAGRSRVVTDGDFLLSNSMSFGRPYIMRTTGCIHDGWLVLSNYQDSFDQDFLYHLLGSPQVFGQFDRLAAGSTVRNLNIDLARRVVVPIPPLFEQRRIVAILDEAFDAIATAKANTEENLQNARDVLDGFVAQQLLDGGQSWSAKKLRELCVVDWGNTKLTKSAYVEGGEFLAVSAAGCDGRIGHREHKAYTPVLSAIGAQCGRMFLPTEDFTAIKNTMTLTPLHDACSGPFLYRLLTAVKLPKRGAAQPFMAKGDIEEFVVRIPGSLEKQNLIVDAVDALEFDTERLAALLERKLAALDELKKSLLQQAFTGQLTGKATDRQLEALA